MNDKERQILLDQALDRLMSGPVGQRKEHHWEAASRQLDDSFSRYAISKQSRKKAGKAIKEWHSKSTEHKKKLSQRMSGESNIAFKPGIQDKKADTFRTSGRLFIELNSKSYGYVSDMKDYFNISKSQIIYLAEGERIPIRGRAVGLLIRYYDKDIHPHVSQLNDIRKIKA